MRFKKKSSCKLIKLKTICNLIIVVLFLCELLFSSRVEQDAEHFPYTLGWLGKGKGGNCKKKGFNAWSLRVMMPVPKNHRYSPLPSFSLPWLIKSFKYIFNVYKKWISWYLIKTASFADCWFWLGWNTYHHSVWEGVSYLNNRLAVSSIGDKLEPSPH